MITQAGPRCDVCDGYILLDVSINPFSIKGIERELHCHDRCKPLVIHAMKQKDWRLLPDGPLKMAYSEAEGEDGG